MYRLVVDWPLGSNMEEAQTVARKVIEDLRSLALPEGGQYRLQDDSDRRPHNYLDINENGHASSKKLPL